MVDRPGCTPLRTFSYNHVSETYDSGRARGSARTQLPGHEPADAREGVREDEARRDGRIEKGVAPLRDRGGPVVPPRDGEVPEVPVVQRPAAEHADETALLVGRQVLFLLRVVDRDE